MQSHSAEFMGVLFFDGVWNVDPAAAPVGAPRDDIAKPPVEAPRDDIKNQSHERQQQWGKRNYILIQTKEELDSVFEKITSPQLKYFALDTETTGLDVIEDIPIGFSLCFEEGSAYYIPTHPLFLESESFLSLHKQRMTLAYTAQEAYMGLQNALQKRSALMVAHNLKFDLHQLKNMGVTLGEAPIACTMVAAWLCNPVEEMGFSLDALTFKRFGLEKIPTSYLIGKESGRASMLDVPLAQLAEYACEDVDATLKLWIYYEKKLKENEDLHNLFFTMEMPILKLLAKMERHGVHIDSHYLEEMSTELQSKLLEIERNIYEKVGFALIFFHNISKV
jgi:DNA polymerase-1